MKHIPSRYFFIPPLHPSANLTDLPSQTTIGEHITRAIISVLAMTTVTFSVYNMVMTAISVFNWYW